MNDSIWLTWEKHRRNKSISALLGTELVELLYNKNRYLRYPILIIRTLSFLLTRKPKLVFVQNPSIVLSVLVVSLSKIAGFKVIVDAHNSGIYPFEGESRLATKVAVFLMRNANLTIVTNDDLKTYVETVGGKAFVLPDPIPEISHPRAPIKLRAGFNVLFICTWAVDEPYVEVIKAATLVNESTTVYISGNSKGREERYPGVLPKNVVLTGFVSEAEFDSYLHEVDLIIDLTTRENCLVCGAYEAVAVLKPLVLSDSKSLKEYFNKGVLYVDNTAESIAAAINKAEENIGVYENEITRLKEEKIIEWNNRKEQLLEIINDIA